eukprot:TRINITY_DN1645_c0_g1_i1.p1 TRINITY_DN1645_c0_g1~~TRINITY_DN1645_c0_g1_i1.p1  ORF type:complete len:347 (-),score=100.51 TRINITY_DN1645_c0_g1_i1:269-1309(-)
MESESEESESEEEKPVKKQPLKKPVVVAPKKKIEVESEEEEESEEEPKPAFKQTKKPVIPAKKPAKIELESEEEESEESEEEKPAPKKKVLPVKQVVQPKKPVKKSMEVEEESEDEEEESEEEVKPKKKAVAAKKPQPKEESEDDEDQEEEEEEVKAPVKAKPSPKVAPIGQTQGEFEVKVAGISFNSSQDDLQNFLSEITEINSVNLLSRPDGSSKGLAFVKVSTEEAMNALLEQNGVEHMGRCLIIEKAVPRGQMGQLGQQRPSVGMDVDTKTIFVGNLNFQTDENSLAAAFAHIGEIEDCRIARDREVEMLVLLSRIRLLRRTSQEGCTTQGKSTIKKIRNFF